MIHRVLLAAAATLLLSACARDAAAPAPVDAPIADSATLVLNFHAIAGLNPGANGAPAPVRVRIFELKNTANFSRADYFALAERAQATLGADLIDQDEVLVQPGEQLSVERPLNPATRQVGLVVGYREIDQALWRNVLNVPPRQVTDYQISLDVRAVRSAVERTAP
ncbi:type VI secretion system lipoprotein TssJ [Pseudomonas gingeri]|uniref:Type VI secretion system lipoprotein TssJ n=1 Tax=Pseudomonas gingeri TaxID=117681 RepID=A0A7Y7YGL2_9PSED|nr:type VI secretion system lipoprotein TssJ [Pseudomonas gingeri]NWA04923.1 type VI secretion system lipoprotein TssJ [Pseudomonas gingeri]NWA17455.1 type VI secretion system lipoprotein TssJ [Pseudomonas gingeri]NWA58706.1 type VI secretion system lipoprotein TssJ [Pseudomonas gingeri]NWA96985.1 type VI secretion system lipoprotein TssJ [Pseudomonas gingeri]NWB05483.1 type VI secretion system lipoprotein TssJ [Pseudomonas gingeri]